MPNDLIKLAIIRAFFAKQISENDWALSSRRAGLFRQCSF